MSFEEEISLVDQDLWSSILTPGLATISIMHFNSLPIEETFEQVQFVDPYVQLHITCTFNMALN